MPEGTYQFVRSDDPNVVMVKNEEGTQTVGYLAGNIGSGQWGYYSTLKEAQVHEHKGDAWRTAGKIALIVLVVTAVAGVVVPAAAAGAPPPPIYPTETVTTRCTTFGYTSTCTSR